MAGGIGSGVVDGSVLGRKIKNLLENKTKKAIKTGFLTSEAKVAFTKLRKTFIEAPILCYFDLVYHIQILTDELRYVIGKVLSQINSDQLSSNHMTSENLKDPNFYKF